MEGTEINDYFYRANGETVMTTTAPDTITTFLATAFAVDDFAGLAVSPEPVSVSMTSRISRNSYWTEFWNFQFVVFQPFFIRANLPYSVKRGEQLGLQVLVFSYQPTPQQVQ